MSQIGDVNPVFLTTSRIHFPGEGGHGTGFFFNSDETTYLVTNKHVLSDEEESHEPDKIRFFIRGYPDVSQVNWFNKDIQEGKGNSWYRHPQSPDADVAVVPLNQRVSSISDQDYKTGSLAYSESNFLQNPDRIIGGDKAQIPGYPSSFYDRSTYFPVLRDASIASPYDVDFDDQRMFVTDARMHGGTSGSPVLAHPESLKHMPEGGINVGSHQVVLMGIHSATYETERGEESSGGKWLNLNAAWYAELIEEIIKTI